MTTMLDKITVFLVSENRLLREALARILNNKSDIAVVGSAAHSTAVVEKIAAISPQVLLFDSLPDLRCELSLVPALHKAVPNLKVVMIGMEPDREVFLWAVRGGIAGYMLKDATAAAMAAAVRSVASNEAVCPPELCQVLFDYVAEQRLGVPSFLITRRLGLTRREQQLVEMIGRGFTNKEIALDLGLSEQTVKNHVHRMLRKVGASDRLAAVEMCRTQGTLPV